MPASAPAAGKLLVGDYRLAPVGCMLAEVVRKRAAAVHRLAAAAHKPALGAGMLELELRTWCGCQRCPQDCLHCWAWDSPSPLVMVVLADEARGGLGPL